eukprot:926655-Prymnesium_polylepis.1
MDKSAGESASESAGESTRAERGKISSRAGRARAGSGHEAVSARARALSARGWFPHTGRTWRPHTHSRSLTADFGGGDFGGEDFGGEEAGGKVEGEPEVGATRKRVTKKGESDGPSRCPGRLHVPTIIDINVDFGGEEVGGEVEGEPELGATRKRVTEKGESESLSRAAKRQKTRGQSAPRVSAANRTGRRLRPPTVRALRMIRTALARPAASTPRVCLVSPDPVTTPGCPVLGGC